MAGRPEPVNAYSNLLLKTLSTLLLLGALPRLFHPDAEGVAQRIVVDLPNVSLESTIS